MSVQIIIIGKPREISPQLAALQYTGIAPAGKPINHEASTCKHIPTTSAAK